MSNSRSYFIRSEAQLAALAAAVRQEVVDVLSEMGTVSVAELAAALGRPADSLYFHLRVLTRAGLVRRTGTRFRAGGKEALYRTVAPELRLQYEPGKQSNRKAVSAIVASMLRLGIRDFTRAIQSGDVVVSGPHRELWALRKAGRLTPAQVANVNESVQDLANAVSARRGKGRLYAITVLLTPLDRHRKTVTKSKRGKKR